MSDLPSDLVVDDPYTLFRAWLAEAEATEPNDPNAMALATVGPDGMPSVRVVLLKGIDDRGLVFYTNAGSRKGEALAATPKAAICLHWKTLRRQIRAEGPVERVADTEADAYFASRARMSQIGAWASEQSRPLADRATLERRVAEVEARYEGGPVPRPPFWPGYRIRPLRLEFWRDGAHRLHDRIVYAPAGTGWTTTRLYP